MICCSGLFHGEVIVAIDRDAHSIVFAMLASDPDLERIVEIFHDLNQREFVQCIRIHTHHL